MTNTTVRAVASVLHVALQPTDAGRSGEKASRVRTPQRPVAEPSPELPRGSTVTRWSKITSNASPGPNPTCRRTRHQAVRFQRVHNTAARGMLVEVEREGDRGKESTYACEPPTSTLKSSHRPQGGQRTLAAQMHKHTCPPAFLATTPVIAGALRTPQEPVMTMGVAGTG